MQKNSQFIRSFILLSVIFLGIFSSIFYLETKRLDRQRVKLTELSKQETALTEHLFVVAKQQGRMSSTIEALILKTNELSFKSDVQSLKNLFDSSRQLLEIEMGKSIQEYESMKNLLSDKDTSYIVNLLSIELYLQEMKNVNESLGRSFAITEKNLDTTSFASLVTELNSAHKSIEKIINSYKNEISFISSNIQTLITSSYNDIYQSNMIMTFVSGAALIGILLYTFFTLIIPLHNVSNLTEKLLKNPHFIEDVSLYPGELQEVILNLQGFTNDFMKKEEQLTLDRVEFKRYEKMKNEYYSQMQNEMERPLEILNNTLHRVHLDKNISSESRKLVELAEHEYEHLKDLLHKAADVSNLSNDPFQIKYSDTHIFEFINGEVANLKKNSKDPKKFYIQVDPSIPSNIYLDQKHVRDILEYAYNVLTFTTVGSFFALSVSGVNLHGQEFILFDLKLDRDQLNTNKKKKDEYLSTFSKHEANSSDFHIYQNLANALGGTLDFKLENELIVEFRLMLPLVGQSELQADLVG